MNPLEVVPEVNEICIISIAVTVCSALSPVQRVDVQNYRGATIVQEQRNDNIGTGNYNFAFQSSDGISREEKAELKNAGSKDVALVVQGSYSYVGTDGVTYTVRYIADENGYRAIGDHIPRNN